MPCFFDAHRRLCIRMFYLIFNLINNFLKGTWGVGTNVMRRRKHTSLAKDYCITLTFCVCIPGLLLFEMDSLLNRSKDSINYWGFSTITTGLHNSLLFKCFPYYYCFSLIHVSGCSQYFFGFLVSPALSLGFYRSFRVLQK